MNLPLKKRLTIYILGIAAVGIFIAVFILFPAIKNILNLTTSVTALQDELQGRYEKTQKLKKSLKELKNIQQETNIMSASALPAGDELKIITELETIAQSHNIEQNLSINFISEKTNPNLKPSDSDGDETAQLANQNNEKSNSALPNYYQLSFLNNGSFVDHWHYLQALEKLPYYVIIDGLNFEKRSNNATIGNTPITLRFNAIIYADVK